MGPAAGDAVPVQTSAFRLLDSLQNSPRLLAALEGLRRQHHALRPVYALLLPAAAELIQPVAQQYLVERILRDPVLVERNARPTKQYERVFWKRVLRALEEGFEAWRAAGADDAALDQLEVDSAFSEAVAEAMVTDDAASCSTADM